MSGELIDPFARRIEYLRVSVTDRCDLRCVYCMAEKMQFLPKKELLSLEELDRLCSIFVSQGVRKLRLTGGEPLVRRNILWLVERLSRHLESGALDELTMTTNATQLDRFADDLAALGIRRINISLDSLDSSRFAELTRGGSLDRVLNGIAAAQRAGLHIKINAVALKGVIEQEIDRMIAWCGAEGFDLSLIEVMPLGDIDDPAALGQGDHARYQQYLSLADLRARIETRWGLTDIADRTGGPARYTRIAETGGRLGFITPQSNHFCAACNRVRLTCTGRLYLCLGQEDYADLRDPLRNGQDDQAIIAAIEEALSRKPLGHDFFIEADHRQVAVPRHMNVTGG